MEFILKVVSLVGYDYAKINKYNKDVLLRSLTMTIVPVVKYAYRAYPSHAVTDSS